MNEWKSCTNVGPFKLEIMQISDYVYELSFIQEGGIFLAKIKATVSNVDALYNALNDMLIYDVDKSLSFNMYSALGERYSFWIGHSELGGPSDDDPDTVYFALYKYCFTRTTSDRDMIFGSWISKQDMYNIMLAIEPYEENLKCARPQQQISSLQISQNTTDSMSFYNARTETVMPIR